MDIIFLFFITIALTWASVYFVMPHYICLLQKVGANQEVSEYALDEFKAKAKTPIMGGLLFVVFPVFICVVLMPNLIFDPQALFILLSFVIFGAIGFIDDFLILMRHNNLGLSPKKKLGMQLISALLLCLLFRDTLHSDIYLPFLHVQLSLAWLYIPFAVLLFASEANAVNFTDGMDGLCAGVSFIALLPFVIIALLQKQMNIALICAAVMAALLAYLHYNSFPARIFMGDSGSLALGGLFTAVALMLHSEVVLFFAGGIFVWEMVCVTLQLSWVKLFHKRLFSYTPIHYAFKLKGISEKRIVESFYLITMFLVFVAIILGVWG